VGMTEVLLHGAEPTEDERSKLRAHVGRMHCVPLAAIYAGYVTTCLMRGEVVEDMASFEARLRQYFMLWSDPGAWADRPIIFEGIVYGVWFNDKTRRFVVDLADAVTSRRTARRDAAPPIGIDTMVAEPKAKYTRGSRGIRRRQPDVSRRTVSHTRQTASNNGTEPPLKERSNA
jgi:hypothetical protein